MTAIGGYYSSGAYPLGGLLLPGGSKMSKGGAKLVGYEGFEARRHDKREGKRKGKGKPEEDARDDSRVKRGKGERGPEACIHPYPSRGGYWDFDYLF